LSVLEVARPKILHAPGLDDLDLSRGQEAIELADSLGMHLDEHQKLALTVICARTDDGRWAFFEVGICEPRQNGKGVILEIREVAGAFLWNEPLVIHSAHQFDTSQEHFMRLESLVEDSDLERQIKTIRRSHGEEGFILKNGNRIRFRTRTKGGGRGFSCDTLVLDEAMVLSLFAHSALLPTLRARPDPQVILTGSAVDQQIHEHGVVFASLRERAIEGEDKSLAYLEWTITNDEGEFYETPDDVPKSVLDDERSWRESNPAFGLRVRHEHFQKERDALSDRGFAVEILGVGDWPRTDGTHLSPIKPEEWDLLVDETSKLRDPFSLAFDISPERRSSIAAVGRNADEKWHAELIANYPGTAKLVERMVELVEQHNPYEIVCDGFGPSASMIGPLTEAGVNVRVLNGQDHAQACGTLVDAVANRTIRHLGSQQVSNALRGAATRPLGDAWAWARRRSSVDISPLVAITLALASAQGLPEESDDINIW